MCIELKIKLKSLAAEQRIIRREELANKGNIAKAGSLHYHRVCCVRPIIRATHIAYGLLNGLEYNEIERSTKTVPHWGKVEAMLKKYGTEKDLVTVRTWKTLPFRALKVA